MAAGQPYIEKFGVVNARGIMSELVRKKGSSNGGNIKGWEVDYAYM